MLALKRGYNQPPGPLSICDGIAEWCADHGLFAGLLSNDAVLVPVPGSALTKPGTLWTSRLLAEALARRGLGSSVAACLSRVASAPKPAFGKPDDGATPTRHCESMKVERMLVAPKNILLVDDLVAKGSTFLGAACRIAGLYPNTRVKAFAAMRTISQERGFAGMMGPREGTITPTRDGHSRKSPCQQAGPRRAITECRAIRISWHRPCCYSSSMVISIWLPLLSQAKMSSSRYGHFIISETSPKKLFRSVTDGSAEPPGWEWTVPT